MRHLIHKEEEESSPMRTWVRGVYLRRPPWGAGNKVGFVAFCAQMACTVLLVFLSSFLLNPEELVGQTGRTEEQ